MTKLLIVLGSARTGRVADKVLGYIQDETSKRDAIETTVADLKELNLPFFDNPTPPASPDFANTDENVAAWTKLVADSDAVLFVTPEYNHSISAIQKNALDWIVTEWDGKPAAVVAYGWSGGSLALVTLKEVFSHLKLDLREPIAQLAFMKDINPDGSNADAASVTAQIAATIDAIES